jgi:hypothetical protein
MDTIYLIRHAERPTDAKDDEPPPPGLPVFGFDASGVQDNKSLTARGWTRSGTWAVYFASGTASKPDRIFASSAQKVKVSPGVKDGSNSRRPTQTVQALADKLGCAFDKTTYLKGAEDALVAALDQASGVTLVAWQHEKIPDIAARILGDPSHAPAAWPGDRFDVIFKFTRPGAGTPWEFAQICPQLLAGDLDAEIPLQAPT